MSDSTDEPRHSIFSSRDLVLRRLWRNDDAPDVSWDRVCLSVRFDDAADALEVLVLRCVDREEASRSHLDNLLDVRLRIPRD